jgi:AcrR family transcriptional regulator
MQLHPTALRRPGRPRSERSRKAILDAAGRRLRERGLGAMTIEGVAIDAGVSKATIYRWWPSKGVLALEAIHEEWRNAHGPLPDSGSLRTDLRARLRATVHVLATTPLGSALAGLIAEAQNDPELAQAYHDRVLEPLRAQTRTIFTRAIERGEISGHTDIEVAIDLFQGPLYLRLLHTHERLDRHFADATADLVTRGLTGST